MSGYLIANVEIHDPAVYDQYRQKVGPIIAQYGGRFIVRGAAAETREGSLSLKRVVVLEFPNLDAARRFYDNAEYAPVKALRLASARSDVMLVEGYAG
ncbi:MAG: DUF1330 domain-containing protein [Stellaceae bacterium]